MTILEFVKLFPGFRLKLEFKHLNADGSKELDGEYCYYGSADDFEERMAGYDWLFDIPIEGRDVVLVKANRHTRLLEIRIEYVH